MKKRKDKDGKVLQKGEIQRKNGLYCYAYVNSIGQRKYLYASTLEQLREKKRVAQRDLTDGVARTNETLSSLCIRYLEYRSDLRESSLFNYRNVLKNHVKDSIGKKKVGAIKHSDVVSYYFHLSKEKNLSFNTIALINNLLSGSFKMAVLDDQIPRSPVVNALSQVKKTLDTKQAEVATLTPDQQSIFLKHASEHYPRWSPLLRVLAGTGMRIGEALALTEDDCDFENEIIHIRHCLYQTKNQYGFSLHAPKTSKGMRFIPMLPLVRQALLEAITWRNENVTHYDRIRLNGSKGFIFLTSAGSFLTNALINKSIRRIISSCNKSLNARGELTQLPQFSCHTMRHTFCTMAWESGMTPKTLQEIMGHASFQTTMDVYTKLRYNKSHQEILQFSHQFQEILSL